MHAVRDGVEVCRGSLDANAALEASHELQASVVGGCWQPEVRTKSGVRTEGVELLRHDSDECCGLAIQDEDRAEDFGIATELPLPESVVHYEHGRSARASIFL